MFNNNMGNINDINNLLASKHGHYSVDIFGRGRNWTHQSGDRGFDTSQVQTYIFYDYIKNENNAKFQRLHHQFVVMKIEGLIKGFFFEWIRTSTYPIVFNLPMHMLVVKPCEELLMMGQRKFTKRNTQKKKGTSTKKYHFSSIPIGKRQNFISKIQQWFEIGPSSLRISDKLRNTSKGRVDTYGTATEETH